MDNPVLMRINRSVGCCNAYPVIHSD